MFLSYFSRDVVLSSQGQSYKVKTKSDSKQTGHISTQQHFITHVFQMWKSGLIHDSQFTVVYGSAQI